MNECRIRNGYLRPNQILIHTDTFFHKTWSHWWYFIHCSVHIMRSAKASSHWHCFYFSSGFLFCFVLFERAKPHIQTILHKTTFIALTLLTFIETWYHTQTVCVCCVYLSRPDELTDAAFLFHLDSQSLLFHENTQLWTHFKDIFKISGTKLKKKKNHKLYSLRWFKALLRCHQKFYCQPVSSNWGK